ncbi:hypothetical protein MA16_Dca021038 [Dendrobium catenatum]|uniref:Uncharacterized protein n=1 Tax=Dendrobium catenatum TaxID=906689 RepID=A0A2I0W5H9_9ASPA|nr:hypothetical protein MA16_Dca021038 [Dendrobium catenatum]
MTGDNKIWDVTRDGFECLDDMGLLEVANLSLDEPELEAMIFNDDDIEGQKPISESNSIIFSIE